MTPEAESTKKPVIWVDRSDYFGSIPDPGPPPDPGPLSVDDQYFGLFDDNAVSKTLDRLKNLSPSGPRSEMEVPTQVADAKDLDRRTPPSLPMVPSHSIAPHNPNPPGGGPYTIKPGERLSDEQPDPIRAGQQYAQAAGHENLSFLESGMLSLLRGVEDYGMGGTAVRLYNDIIQRGRTKTITEGDFMPEEIDRLKTIIEKKIEETGKSEGKIDYPDYKKNPRPNNDAWPDPIALGLGGFAYAKDKEGNITIKDTYDFNVDRGRPSDENIAVQAEQSLMFPGMLYAHIGRKLLPDTGGKGIPVEIKIRNKK